MKTGLKTGSSQRGIVIPLVAIAMLALLGMTGLALDMGHLYINKTRLQNAVDAAALSGAKRLDETRGDQAAAGAAVLTIYNANKANNPELGGAPAPTVEFFELAEGACTIAGYNPCFVRATVTGFALPRWFIQVLGITSKIVAAKAVAGPSTPLVEACDLLPIALCGTADKDCSDGQCYGYKLTKPGDPPDPTTHIILKQGDPSTDMGPGNFHLLDLVGCDNSGADCVRKNLASGQSCTGDTATTKPGNSVAANTGLNTRFGIYDAPFKPSDATIYPPDLVTAPQSPGFTPPDEHNTYTNGYPEETDPSQPGYHRREAPVVFVDCTNPLDAGGGKTTFPVQGYGCFFLDRPADTGPILSGPNQNHFCALDKNDRAMCGQFFKQCYATGVSGAGGNYGPYTIQLYKDPSSSDS